MLMFLEDVPELVIEPALQSEQAGTFDAAEYLPAAHSLHVVAPGSVPVFVMEPGAQSMQSDASFEPVAPTYLPAVHAMHVAMSEPVEYFPASHFVHVVAPADAPVGDRAIEPAAHVMHAASPVVTVYLPAAHVAHAAAPTCVKLTASVPNVLTTPATF